MIKNKIRHIFSLLTPWEQEGTGHTTPTSDNEAFELLYKKKRIGTLEVRNGKWIFQYDPLFREKPFITPLSNFPDIHKTYEFNEIPPFFAARIPSINQPRYREILRKKGIENPDPATLLRLFGRYTLVNPFELKAV
ncbi:MAG: hypothetical protein GXO27_06125 [Chlorobi bacterium]|nr:hypothetical protein [Chlorobiota bacterium]